MAEQYEDWVLERSDLLVANRELEARCLERNHADPNMSRTVEAFKGHMLSTGYNLRTLDCEMYGDKLLPNDEAWLQMKERTEEMATIIDSLNAENLDLQREKQFLGDDMENARRYIAQKEEELAVAKDRMEDAEEKCKQTNAKLEELTVLMDQFANSERNWLSERESLQTEIGRLQLCVSSMEVEPYSGQIQRNECSNRLAAVQQNTENGILSADDTVTKLSKNKEIELANARAVLAGSEEKVKLLTEMVATMGEDWAAERERLIANKEELQMEISRLEQHSDVRRSSDQPLRNLSENHSLPAADGSTNTKYVDKLRQDVERMRTEIVKLRTKVREKDNAILGLRMELSATVASSKELKADTEKLVFERDQLLQAEGELRVKLMTAGGQLKRHEGHVQKCESELERLTMMLLETEERMDQDQQKWMEEKAQLETAREEAELLANEKKNEAAAMLVKFEEWKTTLREADSLVNALVQVNEKAKQRWKREKERLAIAQAVETNQVVEEMLETVGLTQDQVDKTMSHIEGEMRALVVETQILKMEMTTELLKLKREKPGSIDEMSRSIEILPSLKCLDIERRSWEQQFKASLTILSEKEAALQSMQAEIEKSRKQTAIAQRGHSETLKLLQEKEEANLKLSCELNHLNQNANRDRTLRQSLTRDLDAYTSLRRSFSCKLIEEKDTTLSVLKEEQEELKTMVFGLETQNAELQEQLMEAEAKVASLESIIGSFQAKIQESDDRQDEEVRILAEQLKESVQHITDLECHRLELREEMQRQAIAFAELYEQLQKQECDLEGEARTIASKVAEEKEVLQTLEEEKAQLKYMVERLDAELTVYEEKASSAESSLAELERLRLEMEGLQGELHKIESLQEKIDAQNTMLDTLSQQRTQLEENLESKNQELIVLGEELEAMKISADSALQESEKLRDQVDLLQMKTFALEEDLVRRRASIKVLEAELNRVEETMARCLEEATVDLKELETERDKLQSEIIILSDQLDFTQAHADERAAAAVEAQQVYM
jgi:chromosome segregation ATPase